MNDPRRTDELLRRWLRGETSRREEAELEAAAREDAFLAEALAGYRRDPAAAHADALGRLRRRLPAGRQRRRRLPLARLAAAVALLLVVVTALWLARDPAPSAAALAQQEAAPPATTPPAAPELRATDAVESGEALADTPAPPAPPLAPRRQETTTAQRQDRPPTTPATEPTSEELLAADLPAANSAPAPPAPQAPAAAALAAPNRNMAARQLARVRPRRDGLAVDEQDRPLRGLRLGLTDTISLADSDEDGYFSLPDPAAELVIRSESGATYTPTAPPAGTAFWRLTLGDAGISDQLAIEQPTATTDAPATLAEVAPADGFAGLRRRIRRGQPTGLPAGGVTVRFHLTADGRPTELRIVDAPHPRLGTHVLQQVQSGPPWQLPPTAPPLVLTYTIFLR